jgi:divalent metal cation (Fe/Co/Zn/Cd) transporter
MTNSKPEPELTQTPVMHSENVNMPTLLKTARWLAIITIVYNIAEGLISVFFGYQDKTLALFGFGVDSFVEVISGFGILHMVARMKNSTVGQRDEFEKTALRVTGFAFYLLTVGLLVASFLNIINESHPETTVPGLVISVISILTMYFLMEYKNKTGLKLNSEAIIADANCTRTCLYLSVVLLFASAGYEIFRIPYIDVAGSLAIAWFAFGEGKESIEIARSKSQCNSNDHCSKD